MSNTLADQNRVLVHWSFWIISAVALLWNVGGVANYIMQTMNPDSLDTYREAERVVIEGRPAWATSAFAIAVFGGTFGSLLLLFKKSAASHVFIASLAGVIVTLIHAFGAIHWTFDVGTLMPQLMSLAVAGFLIWYSKMARRKSWIS
jgi:hypothetical protein